MKEKKYKIIGTTNSWIAARDAKFNGRCEIIIDRDLTLKQAKNKLFEMFKEDYGFFDNWGLAVIHSKGDAGTREDGTRFYWYDSRKYSIEEETEDF